MSKSFLHGELTKLVLNALSVLVQATSQECAAFIDAKPNSVARTLRRMSDERSATERRVYVVFYLVVADSAGHPYPRPVYSLGSKKNARFPKPKSRTKISADYRRRKRLMAVSVFDYAQTFTKRNLRAQARN